MLGEKTTIDWIKYSLTAVVDDAVIAVDGDDDGVTDKAVVADARVEIRTFEGRRGEEGRDGWIFNRFFVRRRRLVVYYLTLSALESTFAAPFLLREK